MFLIIDTDDVYVFDYLSRSQLDGVPVFEQIWARTKENQIWANIFSSAGPFFLWELNSHSPSKTLSSYEKD